MKSKFFLIFFLLLITILGCKSTETQLPEKPKVDQRFVGTWEGSSFNEAEKYIKTWVQVRDNLGNYKISFKAYSVNNELLGELEESGKWWVEGNVFYEFNSKLMKNPDTYKFKFISTDEIQFTTIAHDPSGDHVENYTFTDKRLR